MQGQYNLDMQRHLQDMCTAATPTAKQCVDSHYPHFHAISICHKTELPKNPIPKKKCIKDYPL